MTIEIHPTARISPMADIEDSVRGSRITVGEGSVIDSFVKIKPAGGTGDLVIGARTIINSGCVLYTGNGIRIGENSQASCVVVRLVATRIVRKNTAAKHRRQKFAAAREFRQHRIIL